MSVVLGLVRKGVTYVGYDSQTTCSSEKRINRDPKATVCGAWIVGCTGTTAQGQVVRHLLDWDALTDVDPTVAAVSRRIVPALRDVLRQSLKVGDGGSERDVLPSILLARRGRLFEVYADGGVCEPADGISGAGSGSSYGMGVLHALRTMKDPYRVLRQGLEAAVHFDVFCAAPLAVLDDDAQEVRVL